MPPCGSGQGYSDLNATYSICLLMRNLWDDKQLHRQFQLVDRESGKVLDDSIEIHTVELAKYSTNRAALRGASVLEQWAYWIEIGEQRGIEIGEQRGIEIGEQRGKLKGSVQIYEELLGASKSSDDFLSKKSTEELVLMVTQLQKPLRDRMS